MKKLFLVCDQGTPERVILHAEWRKRRGKRPSMAFGNYRNPRQALKQATNLIGAERIPELIERAREMWVELGW